VREPSPDPLAGEGAHAFGFERSAVPRAWSAFRRTFKRVNALTGLVGGLLIVVSCIAISNEVVWRYYLRHPHTWSLEFNIFLLIGATFLAAGHTQALRGHVGTEVLETLMPARWNRRRIFVGRRPVAPALRVHRRQGLAIRGRSLGRRLDHRLGLGAAPVGTLFADGVRHDAPHARIHRADRRGCRGPRHGEDGTS